MFSLPHMLYYNTLWHALCWPSWPLQVALQGKSTIIYFQQWWWPLISNISLSLWYSFLPSFILFAKVSLIQSSKSFVWHNSESVNPRRLTLFKTWLSYSLPKLPCLQLNILFLHFWCLSFVCTFPTFNHLSYLWESSTMKLPSFTAFPQCHLTCPLSYYKLITLSLHHSNRNSNIFKFLLANFPQLFRRK